MFFKIAFLMLAAVLCCECVYIYSSFWAPLFDRRILNYQVDAKFDPDAGKYNKVEFEKKYGYRGQDLITDLGNGNGPSKHIEQEDHNYGDVKVFYTYPGAYGNELQY